MNNFPEPTDWYINKPLKLKGSGRITFCFNENTFGYYIRNGSFQTWSSATKKEVEDYIKAHTKSTPSLQEQIIQKMQHIEQRHILKKAPQIDLNPPF
jgi:hypothetical protein